MEFTNALNIALWILEVCQLLKYSNVKAEDTSPASLTFAIVETWNLLSWRNNTVLNMSPDPTSAELCKDIMKTSANLVVVGNDPVALGIPREHSDAHGQSSYITILVGKMADGESIMQIIEMSKGNSVLLVMLDESPTNVWESTRLQLGFFVLHGSNLKLEKIITSRDGNHLVKEVSQVTNSRPQRDIAGAALTMITLPYAPYLFLNDCDEETKECNHEEVEGWLKDMMDMMANRANFTYKLYEETSGLWGVEMPGPGEGINATDGVFRKVLEGENDLKLSAWTPIAERLVWADFSFGFIEREFNCFVNGDLLSNQSHPNFLSSPFSVFSWLIMFAFFITLEAVRSHVVNVSGQNSTTLVIIHLCTGVLEILMIAYYSGALTMFLVSKPGLPFESQVEGMESSNWKLLLASGDEYHLRINFDHDEHPIVKLKHQEAKSEIANCETQRRLQHVLQILNTEPNHFTISSQHRISWARGQAHKQDYANFNLIRFCETIKVPSVFLLPKNSPFLEAINYWLLKINDSGLAKQLLSQVERLDRVNVSPRATAITMEQVSLVARAGTLVLLLVVAICIGENVFQRIPAKRLRAIVRSWRNKHAVSNQCHID